MAVYKVGTLTKSTVTTPMPQSQIISHNLGVTPKLLILFWNIGRVAAEVNTTVVGGLKNNLCIGVYDGTNQYAMTTTQAAQDWSSATMLVPYNAVTPKATITAWNTTTFTLTWSINAQVTADVIGYFIIGGDDISVAISTWKETTTSTNWSITGLSFAPNALLNFTSSVATLGTNVASGYLGYGLATLERDNKGVQVIKQSNVTAYQIYGTTPTYKEVTVDDAFILRAIPTTVGTPVNGVVSRQQIASFNSDGVTIHPVTAPATGFYNLTIFFGGIDIRMVDATRPASGTNPVVAESVDNNALIAKAGIFLPSIWDNDRYTANTGYTAPLGFGVYDGTNLIVVDKAPRDDYWHLWTDRINTRYGGVNSNYMYFLPSFSNNGKTITYTYTGTPTALGTIKTLLFSEAKSIIGQDTPTLTTEGRSVGLTKVGVDSFTLQPGVAKLQLPRADSLALTTQTASQLAAMSRTDAAALAEARALISLMSRTDLITFAQSAALSILTVSDPISGFDTFGFSEPGTRSIRIPVVQSISANEGLRTILSTLQAQQSFTLVESPPNFSKFASQVANVFERAPNFLFPRTDTVTMNDSNRRVAAQIAANNVFNLLIEAITSGATIRSVDAATFSQVALIVSPEGDMGQMEGEITFPSAVIGTLTIMQPTEGVIILNDPLIGTIVVTNAEDIVGG